MASLIVLFDTQKTMQYRWRSPFVRRLHDPLRRADPRLLNVETLMAPRQRK